MYLRASFNYTWAIIVIIVLGNIWFFSLLFKNVGVYADKMSSTASNKYELEDI